MTYYGHRGLDVTVARRRCQERRERGCAGGAVPRQPAQRAAEDPRAVGHGPVPLEEPPADDEHEEDEEEDH